jgi:hypothetical protein
MMHGSMNIKTDRHRGGHDKAIDAFRYYVKGPEVPVSTYAIGFHALIKREFFYNFQ